MTTGMIMMYGGIVGSVFFIILFFVLQGIFKKKRKAVLDELNQDY